MNDKSRQSQLTTHFLIRLNQSNCVFMCLSIDDFHFNTHFGIAWRCVYLYLCGYDCSVIEYNWNVRINIKSVKNECVNTSIYQMKNHFNRKIASKSKAKIQQFGSFVGIERKKNNKWMDGKTTLQIYSSLSVFSNGKKDFYLFTENMSFCK